MSCYYPNGDLSTDGDIPCSGSDACCPLNWLCQSNGLCYLPNENYYGRYTCTDKSWQSPGCPNICTKQKTAAGNEAILECSKGNYCCDANRPDKGCCDTTNDRFQLQDIGKGSQQTSPASSSPKAASSSKSSPSTASNASPPSASSSKNPSPNPSSNARSDASTSTNDGSKSNSGPGSTSVLVLTSVVTASSGGASTLTTSTSVPVAAAATDGASSDTSGSTSGSTSKSKNLGAIIGPAVGVPVALLLLAALAFLLFRRRRKQKQHGASAPPREEPKPMYGDDNKDLADSPYTGKSELEGSPNLAASPPQNSTNGNENGYHTPNDVGVAGRTYRGVSGVPSPMVNEIRNSQELSASPSTTAKSAPSRRSELPADAAIDVEGQQPPAELPGNSYKPYRPPGLGVTNA